LLNRASKLVSNVTEFLSVQYNKAIVGKNAFAHERHPSGWHAQECRGP
jgi:isopropylmalate/homocitrate/citramalate synthase